MSGGVFAGPPRRRCCAEEVPAYGTRPPRPETSEPDPLPRFSLGAFTGGAEIDGGEARGGTAAGELGVLARARLSPAFELEGELSRARTAEGERLDRSLGAALLYNIVPDGTFSPYLLAGLGGTHVELYDGAAEAAYGYAEFGAGLAYRLSDHFSFTGDLRGGARQSEDGETKADALAREEAYARMRLGALVSF